MESYYFAYYQFQLKEILDWLNEEGYTSEEIKVSFGKQPNLYAIVTIKVKA